MIHESIQLGLYGQDLRAEGVNDVDKELVSKYGEDEDIEHMIAKTIQNGIQGDDSEDDMEIEDDELVQEHIQSFHSEKESATFTTKKRGPTMMHALHVLKSDKREVIICNDFGQPVGPVTEGKDVVGEFSRFLGTISRTYNYAPLTYSSWHKVPDKDKLWEYVLEKYIVPEKARSWVLMTIGACWRGHKCRPKSKHFYQLKDNRERWNNRPKILPKNDFLNLLSLWNKKEEKNRCMLARKVRMSQKNNHTDGPKSFARIREEMKNEDPNKEPPNLSQLFERTRKRTDGRKYVDTYNDTEEKVKQMKRYKPEDGGALVEPFQVVMSKEYDGHRRLYGRGVTNKLIKKMNGSEAAASVELEKRELAEKRRELEEDHERMKAELAAEHEKKKAELTEELDKKKAELEGIRNDFNSDNNKQLEDAVRKVIEKLPREIAQKYLL